VVPVAPREDRPRDDDRPVEVDRGGQATYHGPGQVVGYLVAHVRERGPADVVRWMEEGLVTALAALGFPSRRRDTPAGASSLVGVWTPDDRKVAPSDAAVRDAVSRALGAA
jgi:lipoyl(octanoyl) transferase